MLLIKNQKLYETLKFLTQVLLPAIGTLYFSLAGIWNLPSAEQVVGTIVVLVTFLGVVLQLSSSAYAKSDIAYDGAMVVYEKPGGGSTYSLELHDEPENLEQKKALTFKVDPKKVKKRGSEIGLTLVEVLVVILVVAVIIAFAAPGIFR